MLVLAAAALADPVDPDPADTPRVGLEIEPLAARIGARFPLGGGAATDVRVGPAAVQTTVEGIDPIFVTEPFTDSFLGVSGTLGLRMGMVRDDRVAVEWVVVGELLLSIPPGQESLAVAGTGPSVALRVGPRWTAGVDATLTLFSAASVQPSYDDAPGLNTTTVGMAGREAALILTRYAGGDR
jgi:hypothetical protein